MAARKVFRGHRITRWSVVLVAIASAGVTIIASRSTAGGITPSGCTSIQNVPVNYSIDFGAAIQGFFNNFSNGFDGCRLRVLPHDQWRYAGSRGQSGSGCLGNFLLW